MKTGSLLVFFFAAGIFSLAVEGIRNKKATRLPPSRLSRPKVPRYFYPLATGRSLRVSGGWDGLNGNGGGGGGGGFIPPDNLNNEFKGGDGGDVSISSDMSLSLMLFQVFNWYTKSLATHPLITRMATSALLGALGDWICQRLESKTAVFTCNYRRLCVFSLVNGLFLATVIHKWFQFLAGMPILKGLNAFQQALLMVNIYPPVLSHTSFTSFSHTLLYLQQILFSHINLPHILFILSTNRYVTGVIGSNHRGRRDDHRIDFCV